MGGSSDRWAGVEELVNKKIEQKKSAVEKDERALSGLYVGR